MNYLIKNIHQITDHELQSFYRQLNANDQQKINKILPDSKKKQSLIGKMLLNELLIKYYGLSYFDFEITYSPSGKPYIKNPNIYFSISHSFDYVLCCISEKEIGADIEKIREIKLQILKWFATKSEINYILNHRTEIAKRSFQIFTLKEALLKMMDGNPNEIIHYSFQIQEDHAAVCNYPAKFFLVEEFQDYMIAICEKS